MAKGIADTNYKNRFMNGIKMLCGTRNIYEVWQDTMYMFAASIANASILPLTKNKEFKNVWENRERECKRLINKYNKKEQKLFPQMFSLIVMELEKNPWQDLLGSIYMDLEISSKDKGQFFTSYSICELMSDVIMSKKQIAKVVHEKGYVSINDCACGAGATLIAAAERCSELFKKLNYQNHVYFVAQDVDNTVANMCYIQLSLHGLAGYVAVGNTLTEPTVTDLNRIWFTPMWFSDVWSMRRLFHGQDVLGREIKRKDER